MKWINIKDGLPSQGKAVLLYGHCEVQKVTYTLCQSDDGRALFELYHFDGDLKVKPEQVTAWCYVEHIPTP
jgi:hypothetical protein